MKIVYLPGRGARWGTLSPTLRTKHDELTRLKTLAVTGGSRVPQLQASGNVVMEPECPRSGVTGVAFVLRRVSVLKGELSSAQEGSTESMYLPELAFWRTSSPKLHAGPGRLETMGHDGTTAAGARRSSIVRWYMRPGMSMRLRC